LQGLKEDLISELVIFTSYTKKHTGYRNPNEVDPRKGQKFQRTFAKFSQCKFMPVGTNKKKSDPLTFI
jgi:hypothetical protein